MPQRLGRTLLLPGAPKILGYAAVVGQKEGEGPLGQEFDKIYEDTHMGQDSWEKAESQLVQHAVSVALSKAALTPDQIHYMFTGDLLNQNVATTFGVRDISIPLFGVFSACASMSETLGLCAMFIEGGLADHTLAATSSHFCTAERQFRMPLEYGGQRTSTSQWTVTGAGALVVAREGAGPSIHAVTVGKILDLGIKDAANMGAAMAPAACDTLMTFFSDTNTGPGDFDLILTGDLGVVGSRLLRELLEREGIDLGTRYADCGMLIYDLNHQDVAAGGSGCGCSATVLCSRILNKLNSGELGRVLFVATGALMSPTATQQGQSIPGIAHLVELHGK